MGQNKPNCGQYSQNELLAINKGDLTPEDLFKRSLACNKTAKIQNAEAQQDFIADRMRTKGVGNLDELFNKINEMKANGVMDIYTKRFGPIGTSNTKKPGLHESISYEASKKIDSLLQLLEDGAGAVGGAGTTSGGVGAAPGTMGAYSGSHAIAQFGGTPSKDSTRKPLEIKNTTPGAVAPGKTSQDVGG